MFLAARSRWIHCYRNTNNDTYESHVYLHPHTQKHTHQYQYRTLREARNSIPRATWKLKEMRSSRNKGVGSRGRKRGGGGMCMREILIKQFDYAQTGTCSLSACLTLLILFIISLIKLCSNVALAVRHAADTSWPFGWLRWGKTSQMLSNTVWQRSKTMTFKGYKGLNMLWRWDVLLYENDLWGPLF